MLVDARQLHESLGSQQQFGNWIQARLSKFTEDVDFIVFNKPIKNLFGGRPSKDYLLTLDTAKLVAMMEHTDKGDQIRRYFLQVEKNYRQVSQAIKTTEVSRADLARMIKLQPCL